MSLLSFSPQNYSNDSVPPLRAYWWRRQLWLAPNSVYNPTPKPRRLVHVYKGAFPPPPLPETIQSMVEEMWPTISRQDADAFAIEATILRATALEFYDWAA